MKKRFFTMLSVCALCGTMAMNAQIQTNAGVQYLQCMQKDVSTDFSD
jgi:alpha-D-xyloside xylohydrolase